MSPEIVLKKEYRGECADIWAVGVVMFTLVCGTFPFKSPLERELYRKIIKGLYEFPPHVSSATWKIIERMLTIDPLKRASSDALLADPYFKIKP